MASVACRGIELHGHAETLLKRSLNFCRRASCPWGMPPGCNYTSLLMAAPAILIISAVLGTVTAQVFGGDASRFICLSSGAPGHPCRHRKSRRAGGLELGEDGGKVGGLVGGGTRAPPAGCRVSSGCPPTRRRGPDHQAVRSSITAMRLAFSTSVAKRRPWRRPCWRSFGNDPVGGLELLLGELGAGGRRGDRRNARLLVDARGRNRRAGSPHAPPRPSHRHRPDAGPPWWRCVDQPGRPSACSSNFTFWPPDAHALGVGVVQGRLGTVLLIPAHVGTGLKGPGQMIPTTTSARLAELPATITPARASFNAPCFTCSSSARVFVPEWAPDCSAHNGWIVAKPGRFGGTRPHPENPAMQAGCFSHLVGTVAVAGLAACDAVTLNELEAGHLHRLKVRDKLGKPGIEWRTTMAA